MSKPFVPIEELAKHFTVSISTIRAWIRQGAIPKSTYIKVGNTYRFSVDDVADALLGEDEPQTVAGDVVAEPAAVVAGDVVVEPAAQEHALRLVQTMDDHFAADSAATSSVDDDL